ncbi:MAG: glycine--tRNA ligase [Candidatus Paceibacterota bacterium]|jgi:glycyl-tRNA synthetase
MEKEAHNKMEAIVSLAKRRGFIFQGSEIYGGLAGTWDYGPLGLSLKNNIKNLWWKTFVSNREDMYGVDAAIIMNQKVWQATGHASNFSDPVVECSKCKKRFRFDQLENKEKCPECEGKLGQEKQFNMMFETNIGVEKDPSSLSYLRPETAQGMFVNFKNILDSFHPKLPFGMAQIGKAFRNEIAPRDFLFRAREFEQMEIEYFVYPEDWEKHFELWRKAMVEWISLIGLDSAKIYEHDVAKEDLAFYSKKTIDFEYDFPFGEKKELYGLAYRTDFDLNNHGKMSGQTLDYFDEETKNRFIPHVIEPTFGLDRTVLAIISEAYTEDEMAGDKRVYLKFRPNVAPVKIAVFPLLRNKPQLIDKARSIFIDLKKQFESVMFDDNGNIGKRYRRQDEIGTPYCVTIDFDTVETGQGVTVRDRDTGKQERVSENELISYLKSKLGQ